MGIEVNWHSRKGSRTKDNRDYCGLGQRPGATLCIVVDGSSSGPKSGELARKISHELIDWFIGVDIDMNAQAIIEIMKSIHETLSRQFPFDSASYVIALILDEKSLLILHAGDCLLGHHDGENNSVRWLIKPHTLANATEDMSVASLSRCPARHRLTRSFRPKEFMKPEINEIEISHGHKFVVATDGYWADLNTDDQCKFREYQEIPVTSKVDDQSALWISILGNHAKYETLTRESDLDNCYMKSL